MSGKDSKKKSWMEDWKEDENIARTMRWWAVALIVAITVLFMLRSCVEAKELPELIQISDLGQSHNEKRVTIFGWVRDMKIGRGRMGSQFMRLVVGDGDSSVIVFMAARVPTNWYNTQVIAQGIYHESGRFGGNLADEFIIADAIVRDWGRVME